jgi:hypothetical protein
MSQGIKNFRWTSLMWAINDFSLYEMVLGWSTYRKLACLYYMENNKAFTLINGDKAFFFFASRCSCQFVIDRKTMERAF